jgi:hypothetical protein
LLLRDLRQPPRQLDQLGRRPVRRRTGRRDLLFLVSLPGRRVFLVGLPCCPLGRELFLVLLLVSLPRRPFSGEFGLTCSSFASKLGGQPLDVGLQRRDVLAQGVQ